VDSFGSQLTAGYLVIHRDDLAAMTKESFKRILVEQYPDVVEHIRNKPGLLSQQFRS